MMNASWFSPKRRLYFAWGCDRKGTRASFKMWLKKSLITTECWACCYMANDCLIATSSFVCYDPSSSSYQDCRGGGTYPSYHRASDKVHTNSTQKGQPRWWNWTFLLWGNSASHRTTAQQRRGDKKCFLCCDETVTLCESSVILWPLLLLVSCKLPFVALFVWETQTQKSVK